MSTTQLATVSFEKGAKKTMKIKHSPAQPEVGETSIFRIISSITKDILAHP